MDRTRTHTRVFGPKSNVLWTQRLPRSEGEIVPTPQTYSSPTQCVPSKAAPGTFSFGVSVPFVQNGTVNERD